MQNDLLGGSLLSVKRPRQYAHEMTLLKTAEERREFLAKVPEDCRELTKAHFLIWWNHPRGRGNDYK